MDLIEGNSKSARFAADYPTGEHDLDLLGMPLFQKENNLDRSIWKKGLLRVEHRSRRRDVTRYQQQKPLTLLIRIDCNDCRETNLKALVHS